MNEVAYLKAFFSKKNWWISIDLEFPYYITLKMEAYKIASNLLPAKGLQSPTLAGGPRFYTLTSSDRIPPSK